MVTLHAYIFRELSKSFGLSLLALTALFTMGGGLFNILKVEGITAGDIFTVLPMLLPVVITLTMPVAALFAATITYGRLAADNEFVAARAAGINIHRLFFPAISLSLFVTLFTLVSVNLVIPGFMKSIELFALTNIRDLAFNRLAQGGYIHRDEPGKDRYTLIAQEVLNVAEDQLVAKGFERPGPDVGYFWVERPTFLMADKNGELRRFAVAEGGLVQFNTHDEEIKLTLYVKSARVFDGKHVVEPEFQKIGPFTTEIPFTPKPSMVNLSTLSRWKAAPWEAPKIAERLRGFLREAQKLILRDALVERLSASGRMTFHDTEGAEYTISVASAFSAGDRVTLNDVSAVRQPKPDGTDRPVMRYDARIGKFVSKSEQGHSRIVLELQREDDHRVHEKITHADGTSTQRERDDYRIEDLIPPSEILERIEACTPAAVMNQATVLPADPDLERGRKTLWKQAQELRRRIKSVLHYRMSFALSALVTILMGAALGVIFRGSRALAAFGLACIPFAIVALFIAVGKQMIESESTQHVGPWLIWGGLTLVAAADLVILRVGVRR